MSRNTVISHSKDRSVHYVMRASHPDTLFSAHQRSLLTQLVSSSFADVTLSGSLSVVTGSRTIIGSGTRFDNQITVGDTIKVVGPKDIYVLSGSMTASKDTNRITGVSGSTSFDTQLVNGDYVKIVSGSYSSYHSITLSDANHDSQAAAAGTGTPIPTALTGPISVTIGSIQLLGTSGSSNFTTQSNNYDTIRIISASQSTYHVITHSFGFTDNAAPITGAVGLTNSSYKVTGSSTEFTSSLIGSYFTSSGAFGFGTFPYRGTRITLKSGSYTSTHTVDNISSSISMSIKPFWAGNTTNSASLYLQQPHFSYSMSMYPAWSGSTESSVTIYKQYKNSAFSMSLDPVWSGHITTGSGFIYKNELSSSQLYVVDGIANSESISITASNPYHGNTYGSASGFSIDNKFLTLPPITVVHTDLWKADWASTDPDIPGEATSSALASTPPSTFDRNTVTGSMLSQEFRIVTS